MGDGALRVQHALEVQRRARRVQVDQQVVFGLYDACDPLPAGADDQTGCWAPAESIDGEVEALVTGEGDDGHRGMVESAGVREVLPARDVVVPLVEDDERSGDLGGVGN